MKKRSINRFQARELEQKIMPSIKLLSRYMHNTSKDAPEKIFYGYKVPSGTFKDSNGELWQLQIHAYKAKGHFIKDNEIKPIIKKGISLFKLRIFVSAIIHKINTWR